MSTKPSKPIPAAHPNPRILIVGAGIGGLTLANLCEAAGFNYLVFEKTSEFKPLGSAISLDFRTHPVLDQLGIFQELRKVAKPFKNLSVHTWDAKNGKMKFDGVFGTEQTESNEYESLMFARPDLMEALLHKIPKSKILMKKKILNIQQSRDGVMIRAADGSTYHGDILVGADGCYSPVRQSMFVEVEKRKELPPTDKEPLKFDINCVVGVTTPLDPNEFPEVATSGCEFQVVLPKEEKVSVWMMPLSRNRLGWMVNEVVSEEKKSSFSLKKRKEENNFAQTEWSSEAADDMCKRFADYPTSYRTTLKTFIDKTPKELISKVMLEEKFFETWQDGRTCLIGDACHKVLPFGAVGATNAILDAVQVANLLYDLKSNNYEDIRHILVTFYELRKEHGRTAVNDSAQASTLFHTKGWKGEFARHFVMHLLPNWMMRLNYKKLFKYRPQAGFLPQSDLGKNPYYTQQLCERYVMEQKAGGKVLFSDEVPVHRDNHVDLQAVAV